MLLVLLGLALLAWAGAARPRGCPQGTEPHVSSTADGRVAWCARPDGTWHGPVERWGVDGQKVAEGAYVDGEPAGEWAIFYPSGRVARTGQLSGGVPAGRWKTWSDSGAWLGTVCFTPLDRTGGGALVERAPDDPRLWWSTPSGERVSALEWLDDGDEDPALLVVSAQGLQALDPWTGAVRWAVRTSLRPVGQPRVWGGRIAWLDARGGLGVVDLQAGVSWRVSLRRPVRGLVTLRDDGALLHDDDGHVFLIDIHTGDPRWETDLGAPITAVLPGDMAGTDEVILGLGAAVLAVDPDDGRVLWRNRVGHGVHALGVAVDPPSVLVQDGGAILSALLPEDGRLLWTRHLDEGASAGAVLGQDAQGAVWVGNSSALHLDPVLGLPGRRDAIPDGASLTVTTQALCWSAGTQVGCLEHPGDDHLGDGSLRWTVPVAAGAVPPLVTEALVYVATVDGRVIALDRRLSRALAGSDDADRYTQDVTLNAVPQVFGFTGQALGVPLLVVDQPSAPDACQARRAVLDLRGLLPAQPAEADADHVVPLLIDELGLDWWTGEGAWAFSSAWDAELLWSTAEVSYLYDWTARLLDLHPVAEDDADRAELDRLLACELDGVSFIGEVEVDDGRIRRRYQGRVSVLSYPHEVDGVPGCLHDVFVNDEPIGAYLGGDLPGWMDLHLVVQDADDIALTEDDDPARPEGLFDSALSIETLWLGEARRRQEDYAPPLRVSWEGDWLVVSWGDGTSVTDGRSDRLFVPGLRTDPDAVADGQPSVLRRQGWRLATQGLPSPEAPFIEVWSGLGCPAP